MKKEKSFETALKEIQDLVEDLEMGNIPLKKSLAKFNDGVELLKYCKEELKNAEFSVQKVLNKEGKIKFEDF